MNSSNGIGLGSPTPLGPIRPEGLDGQSGVSAGERTESLGGSVSARFDARLKDVAPVDSAAPTGVVDPAAASATSMRELVLEGVRNGHSRDAIRQQVVLAELDREFGPGLPSQVRAAVAEQFAGNPVLQSLFDDVFRRATACEE